MGTRVEELMSRLPDATIILSHLESAMVAAAIANVARLRISDHIDTQPRPVNDIASAAGVDAAVLRRVIRFLASHDFFEINPSGDVSLRPLGRLLRSDEPMWSSLAHPGSLDVAMRLDHVLQTGEPAFPLVYGAGFFDYLAEHAADEAVFADAMSQQGVVLNHLAVPAMSFRPADVVADIGGGTGDLLEAVLAVNPSLSGVLVDLPTVLSNANPALVARGCRLVAADLRGDLPTANVYLLARILHDWSDDDAVEILRAIRRAAPADARLYVMEMVMPMGPGRDPAKHSDMGMLLLFGGGHERTEEEFRALLASGGWSLENVTPMVLSALIESRAA